MKPAEMNLPFAFKLFYHISHIYHLYFFIEKCYSKTVESNQHNSILQKLKTYMLGILDMFLCIIHENLSLEFLWFWHCTDK